MVKQISLHAAGNAERGAYGSKYSDNHLQDSFPNFLFHFLFPFFFLMVQQSVNISYGKSTPHALKGRAASALLVLHPVLELHAKVQSVFLVVNFPFAVLNE